MVSSGSFSFARFLPFLAVTVMVVVVLLRVFSPSDLHDQTQPKTVAYTTNIVLNITDYAHWVLPLELAEYPATKPPLYNWVAVPFVALTDGRYEWAHKVPSIFSFFAINLILFWLLWKIAPDCSVMRYSAILIFSTNYMWFKLAYLARPDSLLTLFLVVGWVAATMLVQERGAPEKQRGWSILLWGSTALALLAKGPAAVLIPLFLFGILWCRDERAGVRGTGKRNFLRPRLQPGYLWGCGKETVRISGGWLGLPLSLLPFGVWVLLAYQINPVHVYEVLIREEVVDRMLGIGAEGTKHGPWDLLRTLPKMPFVFLTRFFPWSIFFIAGLFEFARRMSAGVSTAGAEDTKEIAASTQLWLTACLVGVVLPILFFTFSAGKRGDYIAISFVPAALFVAWALNQRGILGEARRAALIATVSAATLFGLAVYAFYFDFAVRYPLGDALTDFAAEVRPLIEADADERAVEFYCTGRNPLQTLLHQSRLSTPEAVAERFEAGAPFWLFVRQRELEALFAEPWAASGVYEEVARSRPTASGESSKMVEVILYSVVPAPGN